jgi:hypothetical protein
MESMLARRRRSAAASGRRQEAVARHQLIVAGATLTVAAVLALAASEVINYGFRLHVQALDSGVRWSVFGVMSLLAQASVAVVAVARSGRGAKGPLWLALGGLLAALLLVRILLPFDAALLVAPIALVFVLLWLLTTHDPDRARSVVSWALALLFLSFAVHVVGAKVVAALGFGADSWPSELKGILKHSSELAGWMLLATGLGAGGQEAHRHDVLTGALQRSESSRRR